MQSHVDEEVESGEGWNGDVCAGGWGGGDGFGGGDRWGGDWGAEAIFLIRGQFRRFGPFGGFWNFEIEW
jgi:hypothetical protein